MISFRKRKQGRVKAVEEKVLAVEKAATLYSVPFTTLKDSVRGRVHIDTVRTGPKTLFTHEQEAFLTYHLITTGEVGLGYSRQEPLI